MNGVLVMMCEGEGLQGVDRIDGLAGTDGHLDQLDGFRCVSHSEALTRSERRACRM